MTKNVGQLQDKWQGNKHYSENKLSWTLIDQELTFKYHLQNFKFKLNRASFYLAKMRFFIKFPSVRIMYCSLITSYLRYGFQIQGQKQVKIAEEIERSQNKSTQILNFKVHKKQLITIQRI